MQRLTSASLPAFLVTNSLAVVLYADDHDPDAMTWAEAFALVWVEARERRLPIAFGYLDMAECEATERFYCSAPGPTILAFRQGMAVANLGRNAGTQPQLKDVLQRDAA